MRKQFLSAMILCGALLVGCVQSNVVDEVVEDDSTVVQEELSEEEKQAMIDSLETKEDWFNLTGKEINELFGSDRLNFYRAYENKFGESYHVYADAIYEAQEQERLEQARQERLEQWNAEYVKPEPKPYDHVGFCLDNFENVKIGDMTVSEVNEMFGFEGTLIGEAKGVKTYEWSKYGDCVQIVFVDGVASSKAQSGLN